MPDETKALIIELLRRAYNAEVETIANYIANSVQLDGFRAKHIKDSLAADVAEELGHAQQLANRIHVIGGDVPGSLELKMTQTTLQPPADRLDVVSVINGVIDAERSAIATYQELIDASGGVDPVTEDLAITLKGDEEEHLREFEGFLAEAKAQGL